MRVRRKPVFPPACELFMLPDSSGKNEAVEELIEDRLGKDLYNAVKAQERAARQEYGRMLALFLSGMPQTSRQEESEE